LALRIENKRAVWATATKRYPISTPVLALSVAVTSFLAARLGGVLAIPHEVSALWPGNALLVPVLLLVPRRTWPVLFPAALAGFELFNLWVGLSVSTSAFFTLANAVVIIIVTMGLGYSFERVPRLNTLRALAKYSLFAILIGPFVGSFVGALALPGPYLTNWRIFFFAEAIAFLTFTPALLSWASPRSEHARRTFWSRLEAAALLIALALLGCSIFFSHWRTPAPVLLYSLLPFLLWAALRFGSWGVSTSIVVIALCSIWGAIHGLGPFTGTNPLPTVLSLQLFLVFAAVPFTLLAVVVEEREQARLVAIELSKRLISEQEKERSRIAGELHDDICQRLAMLSMEVEKAKSASSGRISATKSLEDIRQHCFEIATDVQSLSHELHSSKLDLLGIVVAIRWFCRELSKQHGIRIDFSDSDVPQTLPKDISLCLFRVAQESLHNAVKHSGADRVKVELSRTENEVRLQVADLGAGFDVEGANKSRGLGLMSMQERVRAFNGRFYIQSKVGAGTKIIASVPVPARNSAGETSSAHALNVVGTDEPTIVPE